MRYIGLIRSERNRRPTGSMPSDGCHTTTPQARLPICSCVPGPYHDCSAGLAKNAVSECQTNAQCDEGSTFDVHGACARHCHASQRRGSFRTPSRGVPLWLARTRTRERTPYSQSFRVARWCHRLDRAVKSNCSDLLVARWEATCHVADTSETSAQMTKQQQYSHVSGETYGAILDLLRYWSDPKHKHTSRYSSRKSTTLFSVGVDVQIVLWSENSIITVQSEDERSGNKFPGE